VSATSTDATATTFVRDPGTRLTGGYVDSDILRAVDGDWVMMVYRPDLSSFAWWHEAGGFKIKYPCYDWYENSTKMLAEIQIQNEAMLSYANEVDAVWRTFTPAWQQEHFGTVGTGTVPSKDILVTMLK
jgi:hypothetical protein